ncbi:MAG: iron-containing alcohol dehydrogenase family protein [Candidatus Zophobacter franzmannii]|nr:iron-containing alcohol dehydrogenase family protein [Candidatus Zophobacter franzmannii]
MESFFIPTKIIFGLQCIAENHSLFRSLGKKALIVTGKNSAVVCGALDDVLEALKAEKIDYVIYNGITENPTLDSVEHGRNVFKEEMCDFVIAIGGGSPIDAAKAIAVLGINNMRLRDVFSPCFYDKAAPLIAIPTTSGTGTEATPYSVITDVKWHTKEGFGAPCLFPTISFCDPKYTLTMSDKVTRDTGIDALSHLLEGVYSKKRSNLLMPIIAKGIELVFDNLAAALDDPGDVDARSAMMQASLYGGMAIAHTGTTLQHSIGYPVTTEFGVSHGLSNGIFMKYIMQLYHPHIATEIDEMLYYIGLDREEFYAWLNEMGLDDEKLELSDEFIKKAVPEVMNSRNMALNPMQVTEKDVIKLYRDVRK